VLDEYTAEEWRPVAGYEGLYEVSSLGRVRRAGRVLKPGRNPRTGYLVVSLWHDGKGETHTVHRLVAHAFIGPCPPGQHVNHRDFDRANARADNLEYLTPAENNRHTVTHGRGVKSHGERHYSARLTEADVRAIRESDEQHTTLARRYGVTAETVRSIRHRQTWRHLAE
jgi:hypothetical protein